MACPDCVIAIPLTACISSITIGRCDSGAGNLGKWVWLKNLQTGKVQTYECTTDVSGFAIISTSDYEINPYTTYEIWITTVPDPIPTLAYFPGDRETFQVPNGNGYTSTNCVQVRFEIYNRDGATTGLPTTQRIYIND